jgi:hypothetical protein
MFPATVRCGNSAGNVPDAAMLRADRFLSVVYQLSADAYGARIGVLESRENTQQGRLAATGGAQHSGDAGLGNGEVERVQNGRFAVGLGQSMDLDRCHPMDTRLDRVSRSNHNPRSAPGTTASATMTNA